MKLKQLVLALLLLTSCAHAGGETTSPNMGLTIPGVGVTSGPDWANDINVSLGLIDQHDHTPGNGVQITPAGINISSDLLFNNNNATNLRSSRFQVQASPLSAAADVGALYVSGVDLYYNDENGNQIRITQGGAVSGSAGTITGLPSGTASAAFSAAQGTFVFQQATSTAANMDIGTLLLRYPGSYPSPAGNYIALQAPASLATGYAFTLPNMTPAAAGAFLTSDTSGALSYTNVDNSTLQISSSTLQVKAGGVMQTQLASNSVGTAQIQDAAVTPAKLSAINNGSSGNFSATGFGGAYVNFASASITSNGRSVMIVLNPNNSAFGSFVQAPVNQSLSLRVLRDGSQVGLWDYGSSGISGSGGSAINYASGVTMLDTGVPAGAHTYILQGSVTGGSAQVTGNLVVEEL